MKRKEMRAFGFGGQGIITLTRLIGEAGIFDGNEVIMTEEYSPYITGGWSRADLILSGEKIDYPMVTRINYLIALSQEGLEKNANLVAKDGMIFIDSSMVDSSDAGRENIVGINARELAESIGSPKVANIVMLGFFNQITEIVSKKALENAVLKRFPQFKEMNVSALETGYREAVVHV